MLLAGDPAHAAPSATEKCQQAKLKAQVQLRYCLSKNEAGLLVGKPDQAAACRDKFAAAYCTATALPPSQHWDVSFFPPRDSPSISRR